MLLRDYLKSNKIKFKDFAEILGTSARYVSAIATNRRAIGKEGAKKIEKLTNGQCTRLELLYPEEYTKEEKTPLNNKK